MRTVTANKAELVATLISNMRAHEADFLLAWKAWQEKVAQDAAQISLDVAQATPGVVPKYQITLTPPTSHTDDYARAIAMCNWEVAAEVTLDEHEFRQYVQDEWDWSRTFTTSNKLLTGSERPSST